MPNSPLLDEHILAELKEKLATEQELLQRELERFAEENPQVAGDWKARYTDIGDDVGENAQEVADYEAKLSLERTLEERLQKVKGALARMEANSYGWCGVDKEPISVERLRANPEATTCLEHSNS